MQKKFSSNEITEKFEHLFLKGWSLSEDKIYIQKTFVFKNFKEAFSWMTNISIEAEALNHHPEWSNVYNKVDVHLSTHDVSGLSKNDFLIASYMDQQFISRK